MKRMLTLTMLVLVMFSGAAYASECIEEKSYQVHKGDWLSKITFKFRGTTDNQSWKELANYNQIKNPDRIYPGQVIYFPPEWICDSVEMQNNEKDEKRLVELLTEVPATMKVEVMAGEKTQQKKTERPKEELRTKQFLPETGLGIGLNLADAFKVEAKTGIKKSEDSKKSEQQKVKIHQKTEDRRAEKRTRKDSIAPLVTHIEKPDFTEEIVEDMELELRAKERTRKEMPSGYPYEWVVSKLDKYEVAQNYREYILDNWIRPFLYKHPGGDPYGKNGDVDLALKKLEYSAKAQEALKKKILANEYTSISLYPGDFMLAMMFSKKGLVEHNVIVATENPIDNVRLYEVEVDGFMERLVLPEICWNWSRLVPIPVVKPPEVQIETPEVPEQEIEMPPVAIEIPEGGCIDHEPNTGAGIWGNGIAEGQWAYAEYVAWLTCLSAKVSDDIEFGLGVYGSLESGESKISAYEWDGYRFGPQIAARKIWLLRDEEGKNRLRQVVGKFRLVWEQIEGKNKESGYSMNQDGILANLYGEYVFEQTDRWTGILAAEAWIDLKGEINSTWEGDSPADRSSVAIMGFERYKINDDWDFQFGGATGYQFWDEMFFVRLQAEGRWNDTIMFGPYLTLFPFKSDVYNGIPLSDLQTWGFFVRFEFGKLIRDYYAERRAEKIIKINGMEGNNPYVNPYQGM